MTLSPQSVVLNVVDKPDAAQNKPEPQPKNNAPPNPVVVWCATNWKAILAELVSTTLLITFGCLSCIPVNGQPVPTMYAPFGFGLAVLFNIQTFGHISGAHMNPAVTLSAIVWGNKTIVLGIAYIVAQFIGSIIGYGIVVGLSPTDLAEDAICVTLPHLDLTLLQAIGVEVVLTAALCFMNCAIWDPANGINLESLATKFGLTVAGLSLAGGPLTGASMNPARSLGPALWTGVWRAHWVYYVGPIIGGLGSTLFYKYLLYRHTEDQNG